LLDPARQQIGGLPTNQNRLEEERLALALVAGAADERIFFSYPRLDQEQGRHASPHSTALKPFAPPRDHCPTSANSPDDPRQPQTRASVSPPRLIQPQPLMMPNTISLF
jgi:hypothetical protein